jgi:hypothetical protein
MPNDPTYYQLQTSRNQNFRNEIVWERTTGRKAGRQFGRVHDVILFYSKSDGWTWNPQSIPQTVETVKGHDLIKDTDGRLFRLSDLTGAGQGPARDFQGKVIQPPGGRHWMFDQEGIDKLFAEGRIAFSNTGKPRLKTYLEDLSGVAVRDIWTEIEPINSAAAERLGYPTQKPQALLERIISASSNPGDIVLDPFGGCGTTIHAAQKTGRQWIGIDVTYLAINLIKRRLKDAFGDDVQFEEKGQPTDFGGAQQLFKNNPWQFQQWALSLIDARPRTEGEGKGADRGVDGMLYFYESKDKREKILVQIKGGHVGRDDVATLLGDVNNQKFVAGILTTLEKPTKPMREEAADAGRYESKLWHKKDYPKIQILTIEGLLDGSERVDSPPQENPFAKAGRETIAGKHTAGKQSDLI